MIQGGGERCEGGRRYPTTGDGHHQGAHRENSERRGNGGAHHQGHRRPVPQVLRRGGGYGCTVMNPRVFSDLFERLRVLDGFDNAA